MPKQTKKVESTKNAIRKTLKEKAKKRETQDDSEILDEEVWAVINQFFSEIGLDGSQIRSYNEFIHMLPEIIKINSSLHIKKDSTDEEAAYLVEFSSPFILPPTITETTGETHSLFPMEALWRNATYGSPLYVDVSITSPNKATTHHEKVQIGVIPVMVKSKLCNFARIQYDHDEVFRRCEDPHNPGGYFIISPKKNDNWSQCKIVVPQESPAYNRVFVHQGPHKLRKYPYYAEVRNSNASGVRKTTTTVGITERKVITTMIPWIDLEVPLGVLFCALGVVDHSQMIRHMIGDRPEKQSVQVREIVTRTLEASYECDNQEAALHLIGRKGKKFASGDEDVDGVVDEVQEGKRVVEATSYATHLLTTELFPHIGFTDSMGSLATATDAGQLFDQKARYLGYVVNRLLQVVVGVRKPDNRDHYGNKRVYTAGAMLAQQFHGAFRKMCTEIVANARKALANNSAVNIMSSIKPSIITNAMHGALSANNWTFGGPSTKGAAQLYEQFNYPASIANLRKIKNTMNSDGIKVIAPRDINSTHWGVVCPSETPEGKTVGLVKNQALSCIITSSTDPGPVKAAVEIIVGSRTGATSIFLNGTPIGTTSRPVELVSELVKERRRGNLHWQTSIAYVPEYNEVQLSTEGGRLCRPLFIVRDGELTIRASDIRGLVDGELRLHDLLTTGKLEVIDKIEEEYAIVALYPSDVKKRAHEPHPPTHCEIHPSLIYGAGASLVQRPSHSQSPRITYHASMIKQAVGMPFINYSVRSSGSFHVMMYPQCQLSATRAAHIIGVDVHPVCQNAMVAVMSREFNEEDSIEVNMASVQRGFMVSDKFINYCTDVKPERDEIFGVPTEESCERLQGNACWLHEEGYARKGSKVFKGDVLIGKMIENRQAKETGSTKKRYVDCSITYDGTLPGIVHAIQIGTTAEGYRYIRITVIQRREPVVGDKFATPPSQKGTISSLVPPENLPFTKDGIVPDIVINALAFPSRMTIGTLIETLTGKIVTSSILKSVTLEDAGVRPRSREFAEMIHHPTQKGCTDSTPFRKFDMAVVRKEAALYGLDCGQEYMTDGVTGRPLRSLVFMGPLTYQRLKHMAGDKIHARSKGGKTTLTRQPPDGRTLGGGLRSGGMERDCMMGQGAAYTLRDRLFEQSDPTSIYVCRKCGLPAQADFDGQNRECRVCEGREVDRVKLPHGAKLVMQELSAMGIVPRIIPKVD